jgi:hypothetical protein
MFQRRQNHGFAVTLAAQFRVRDDVLQETVASSSAQQVRCRDEHAGRSDATAMIGHEDADARLREGFPPDAFGALSRLRGSAHLRHIEEREECRQIRGPSEASDGHSK